MRLGRSLLRRPVPQRATYHVPKARIVHQRVPYAHAAHAWARIMTPENAFSFRQHITTNYYGRTNFLFGAPTMAKRMLHQQSAQTPPPTIDPNPEPQPATQKSQSSAPAKSDVAAAESKPGVASMPPVVVPQAKEENDLELSPEVLEARERQADAEVFELIKMFKEAYIGGPGAPPVAAFDMQIDRDTRLRLFSGAVKHAILREVELNYEIPWYKTLPNDIWLRMNYLLSMLTETEGYEKEVAAKELIAYFEKLATIDLRSRKKYCIAAALAYGDSKFQECIDNANKALEADPECYLAYQLKAWSYFKQKMYDDALVAIDCAIARVPSDNISRNMLTPQLYEDRGNILYKLGRMLEAAIAYETMLTSSNNLTRKQRCFAHSRAAACHLELKNYDKALQHVTTARRIEGLRDSDKYLLLEQQVEILLRTNRFVEASVLAMQMSEVSKFVTLVFFITGLHFEHVEKNPSAAHMYYNLAIKAHPHFLLARHALVSLCTRHADTLKIPDDLPPPIEPKYQEINLMVESRVQKYLVCAPQLARMLLNQLNEAISESESKPSSTSLTPSYLVHWKDVTLEALAKVG